MAVRQLGRAVRLAVVAPGLALAMATCDLPRPQMPRLTVTVTAGVTSALLVIRNGP